MYLSDHFTLSEMTKSSYASRHKIDNEASSTIIQRMIYLATEILEPVRIQFGIPFSPTSAYRCLSLNRALGSNDNSQHVKGEAVDLELPGISNFDLATWITQNLKFDQLILEYFERGNPNSGWIHCSCIETGSRGQVLTYDGTSYTKNLKS